MRKKLLATSIIAASLPNLAIAAAIEEVVVTAQKRAESVNDVGLSISAATSDRLEALGVTDTSELAKVAPGLVFTVSQNGTPLYTIRGVGFNDYTLGASPAVSVYVDEVPLAYSAFTKGATLDLERVEVLKGPQGLLFGQNSTGGAINYVAAKPTQEFQAGIKGSYGTFNRFDGEGFVSGGLMDTLSARLAIGATQSEDWQESISSSRTNGGENLSKGRLQFLWNPTDTIEILAGVNGWRDKSDPQAAQLKGLALQNPNPQPPFADVPETLRRIGAFQALPLAGNNARDADWGPFTPSRDDDFTQYTLRADFTLNDHLTLTSITSYAEYNEDYVMDRDGSTLQNAGITSQGSVDSFGQELRLSGDADALQWVVGLNYASNDTDSDEKISTRDSTNTAILPAPAPWIDSAVSTLKQEITDKAIFGNIEYEITDSLKTLVGARYSKNENDSSECMHEGDAGIMATFPFIGEFAGGRPLGSTVLTSPDPCMALNPANQFRPSEVPLQQTLDEHNTSWRVGLNYSMTSDLLVYGLISKGYKTGSFPELPASSITQYEPVTQESVLAYEVGAKWSSPQQDLQVNGALFYYEYEDKQVRGIVKDPVFNQLDRLVNIPKSDIQGAEIEIVSSPIDGLLMSLSATYIDSEVKDFYTFNNALTGQQEDGINGVRQQGDFSGSELPFTPKAQLVADVEYRWPVAEGLEAFVGGNVLYNSEANSTFGDPQETRIDAFTTLDLRVGVSAADRSWSASVWGRNVTDEYYWSNAFVAQDSVVRYAAKPATYGVAFSYKFN